MPQPALGSLQGGQQQELPSAESIEHPEDYPFQILGSLHEQYVILQSEDGIVFLDPKAAIERIHYEQVISGMKTRDLPTQPLLVPVVLELESRDADFVLRNTDNFKDAGLGVEAFGGHSVQVVS